VILCKREAMDALSLEMIDVMRRIASSAIAHQSFTTIPPPIALRDTIIRHPLGDVTNPTSTSLNCNYSLMKPRDAGSTGVIAQSTKSRHRASRSALRRTWTRQFRSANQFNFSSRHRPMVLYGIAAAGSSEIVPPPIVAGMYDNSYY